MSIPNQDTNKKEDELWQIIENQSTIIAELQKALTDMTVERDNLLDKLKSLTIPTPPPRSPFRHHLDMKQQDALHIKVKSVRSSTFVLSILSGEKELWTIEKFYSDFTTLKHMTKIQVDMEESMIEEYFKQILASKFDPSSLYSFITPNKKKEGYLYKSTKNGWKKYYFILSQNELLYYTRHDGYCTIQSISLVPETQVGRQTAANQNDSVRFAFIIVNDTTTIMLSAKSDKEREKWIQALVHYISRLRDYSSHSLPNLQSKSSTDSLPMPDQELELKKKNNHKSFWPLRRAKNKVFGCSIDKAPCVVSKEGFELPTVVYRCVEFIETRIKEEGIYRVSGNLVEMNQLKSQFCEHGDVDLTNNKELDTHIVAGLLKLWIRELPENILTNELLDQLIPLIDKDDNVKEIRDIIQKLPVCNYQLLYFLCNHFMHVIQESKYNKMTLRNISIVFSPTLSIPNAIFSFMITEFDSIFKQQPQPTTSADRIKQNYLKKLNNKKSQIIIV